MQIKSENSTTMLGESFLKAINTAMKIFKGILTFIFFTLCLLPREAYPQHFLWSKDFKGYSSNPSITCDDNGNNYFAFKLHNDTVIINKDTLSASVSVGGSSNQNSPSILIVGKYDSAGNPLWGYQTDVVNKNGYADQIDIQYYDSFIYVLGSRIDTVIFSKKDTLTALSQHFLLKLNINGTVKWVKNLTLGVSEQALSVKNNCIILAKRNPSNGSQVSLGKYNTNGKNIWLKQSAFTPQWQKILDIDQDSVGNIYGCGVFAHDSFSFSSQTTYSKYKSGGTFIFKFDSSGTLKWLKNISGGFVNDIEVTPYGNFLVSGFFEDSMYYRGKTLRGSDNIPPRRYYGDIFMAYLDPAGKLNWWDKFGNPNLEPQINDIAHSDGNFFLCGSYDDRNPVSPIRFKLGNDSFDHNGNTDLILYKLDQWKEITYAHSTGGPGYEEATSLADDGSGNIYMTGRFDSMVQFDHWLPEGDIDIFVTRLTDARISLERLNDSILCTGETIRLPFSLSGKFKKTNTFTLQLSDKKRKCYQPPAP